MDCCVLAKVRRIHAIMRLRAPTWRLIRANAVFPTSPFIDPANMYDLVLRAENVTDAPAGDDICSRQDPGLYIQIMGTLVFVLVWPFIVLDMKWFPLGRPAAALVGGLLMVVFQIVTQDEVYEIQGERGNLQTIFLLIGMMMLSFYFDREGLLRIVSLWIFGDCDKPFRKILWKVCLLSAALSAFITNDAAVLVITPLLLSEMIKQGRSKRELLPLCLGIATSANIGSAATVFGNPQNAFIASAGEVALIDFFIAELPAAIFGTFLSLGLLHLFFFRVILGRYDNDNGETESIREANGAGTSGYNVPVSLAEERESVALSHDQSEQPYLSSQLAKEREMVYSTENLSRSGSTHNVPKSRSRYSMPGSQGGRDQPPHSASNPNMKKGVPDIQLEDASDAMKGKMNGVNDKQPTPEEDETRVRGIMERTWREKIFILWLCFVSVALVVLLAVPPPPTVTVEFNLGCIPLAAAISTMLADTIINRRYAYDCMLKIDWTVILMFMGLFIWLGGFQNTCFPYLLFNALAPYMNLFKIEGVLLFSVFVLIGSNIFSNVPLVILIVHRIDELCGDEPCTGPLGGLLLAWVSTVAGNFTLIGSVANLIVAEKARSSADFRLTFFAYLRFGAISTVIVIFTALPIVYFLGRIA